MDLDPECGERQPDPPGADGKLEDAPTSGELREHPSGAGDRRAVNHRLWDLVVDACDLLVEMAVRPTAWSFIDSTSPAGARAPDHDEGPGQGHQRDSDEQQPRQQEEVAGGRTDPSSASATPPRPMNGAAMNPSWARQRPYPKVPRRSRTTASATPKRTRARSGLKARKKSAASPRTAATARWPSLAAGGGR